MFWAHEDGVQGSRMPCEEGEGTYSRSPRLVDTNSKGDRCFVRRAIQGGLTIGEMMKSLFSKFRTIVVCKDHDVVHEDVGTERYYVHLDLLEKNQGVVTHVPEAAEPGWKWIGDAPHNESSLWAYISAMSNGALGGLTSWSITSDAKKQHEGSLKSDNLQDARTLEDSFLSGPSSSGDVST